MIYMPFFDEAELFEDDIEKCRKLFEECDDGDNPELTKIEVIKRTLFPHLIDVEEGREMVEKAVYDNNLGTELDPKGVQQAGDEEEIGCEDEEEYSGFNPDGLEDHDEGLTKNSLLPDGGFQVPDAVNIDELLKSTRQLVNEQKDALNIIIVTAQLNLNWSWCETLKWVGSHHPTPPPGTFKALPGNLGS